jgi:small-conductance mechanosensitive channel
LLAVCVCIAAAFPATAKDPKPARSESHEAAKLPDPLTKESIRELVSRLSDAEVRALLIKQLDRAAVAAPAAKQADDMAMMAQATGAEFARVRERARQGLAAVPEFPQALGDVGERVAAPFDVAALWRVVFWFGVMLGVGAACELAFGFAMRDARRRVVERAADGLAASTLRFVLRAGFDLLHLAFFAAGGVGLFFALWQGHEGARLVMLVFFAAIVAARIAVIFSKLLLEPSAPALRPVPLDDGAARTLHWGIVRLALFVALGRAALVVMSRYEATQDAIVIFEIAFGTLGLLLVLDTVWRLRAPVAGLIRGTAEPGPLRRMLAELWAALTTIYLLLVFMSRLYDILAGQTEPTNAPLASVLLVLLLPLLDMYACRATSALLHSHDGTPEGAGSLAASFEPVLHKAIHIVVIVAGLLAIADLWQLDLFALAQRGMGSRITGAAFGVAITLLIAWVLWQVAITAIDQRMRVETVGEGKTVSRLRTLLPLMRMVVQATIVVIAGLSVLAALGINILPLLAGASVVGLAIGFGSQTLVRDIVSGAFFLMDDAFRLGEYIEVGDAKGTVEKIGVRSVILRHHRGALNVLPYGEIKRLRNTTRDWIILVMEFRLALDTDVAKVKKLMKKIGQELAANPEFEHDLLEPLKSQGVRATDEMALTIRAKFKMRAAGGHAFVFRREAYERILKAFAENGIRFARRQVTVNVPQGAAGADASGAAADVAMDASRRAKS